MLEVKDIRKEYKTKSGNNEVLKGISLKFDNKGMTFILGKSGSGKTTLLNLLGGLDKVTSGEIVIDGKSFNDFKESDYTSYRNNYIGFIFQDYNNLDELSVLENITLSNKLQNRQVDSEKLDNLLKKLDIYDLKKRKINELSGGEKQRVAIARALLKNSKIILADEPTGNLDSINGKNIMDILKEISKDRLVIVVTHDIEFARTYADRIIEIKDGVIASDTLESSHVLEEKYLSKKNRLPLKELIKLSILPLKSKKVRLFLTCLLIAFTTMFLAIFYCITSYNPNEKHIKIINTGNTFLEIKKYQKIDASRRTLILNNDEIDDIKKSLDTKVYPLYNIDGHFISFWRLNIYEALDMFNDVPEEEKDMYTLTTLTNQVTDISYLKDSNLPIIGNYPKKTNEIIISNYFADLIMTYGIYEYGTENLYRPSSYEQLIKDKKKISFGNSAVIISGIVNYDLTKYQVLKGKYATKTSDEALYKIFNEHSLNVFNIYNKVFVTNEFIDLLTKNNNSDISLDGLLFNTDKIKDVVKKYPLESDYSLVTKYADEVRNYNDLTLKRFKPVVNIIILVFTIFSYLLISNFVTNSIKTRRKSIGILRALGINQKDVFKIFMIEFIILSLISTILSTILSYFIFILLRNTTFNTSYDILNPFYLNYKLVIFIYLYTILVITISSIIPLSKFLKRSPIDVIRNKK